MKKGENDEDTCNDTVGYVYGGIFKMIYEKFCMIKYFIVVGLQC